MPGRILIVEDNPANLELMRYLLLAFGHTVTTAGDGAAGLEAARSALPDLIICDIQLPVLDGFEVARRLRDDARLGEIPLLAVTAFAMVGDREKLLADGFDGYLAKPIEPESFVGQVEAFLQPQQRSIARVDESGPTLPSPSASLGSGRLILAVDDRRVNLEFAMSLLERSGFEVVTAATTAAALELARTRKPTLILSDVQLEETSGYDLIRQVKADPQLRPIPFVFITSTLIDAKDRVKGLALGAMRYLIRPIEPETLLAEIESCLSNQSQNDG